jgi:CBS domain-containing protein
MTEKTVATLMTRDIISVPPETTVREAERILSEHHISGVPVVDAEGKPLGVVSQHDLVRHEARRQTAEESGLFFTDEESFRELAQIPVDLAELPVERVMSRDVYSIRSGESPAAAARLMRELHVHRLLVMENETLVGIITPMDLIRALED